METQQPNFEQQVNSENTNIRTPQETQKVLEGMLAKLEEQDFRTTLKQIDFEDTLAKTREGKAENKTAQAYDFESILKETREGTLENKTPEEAKFDALLEEAYAYPIAQN